MLALKILMTIFFNTASYLYAIPVLLLYIGLYRMFQKSGVKGWHALIPGVRPYQLARCAGRESEGPVFAVVNVLSIILDIVSLLYNRTDAQSAQFSAMDIVLLSVGVSLTLVNFISKRLSGTSLW